MNRKQGAITLACGVICLWILTVDDSNYIRKKPEISDNSKQRDIMVGIFVTEHTGYTNFTSSVIKQYQEFEDSDIHLFNNYPAKYDERSLRLLYGDGVTIIKLQSSIFSVFNFLNHRALTMKQILETFQKSNYKILFLINSEMIVLPSWKTSITEEMINHDVAFLSLYHSASWHSYSKDCENSFKEFCRGKISGKFGIAITRELVNIILLRHADLLNDNTWTDILMMENVDPLYQKKSLIMQIGQTNQDKNFCGKSEVPYGFNLCEFPEWIKKGVEFYFDRCTNPEEVYQPGVSIKSANKEHRPYNRPVISYSLYGNKTRYTRGALENSRRVFSVYPGWKIWLYIDNTVPKHIVDQLCQYDVKFINMTNSKITNQMSWRFLVASEPVSMYAIRDIDSLLIERGKTAVDEWIRSGRKFHVMRDHKAHSRFIINGGMWGGLGGSIPDINKLIMQRRIDNKYMSDMNFLRDVIWKRVQNSVWTHDSHSLHKFGEDHPFAGPWSSKEFVGKIGFH